MEEKKLTDEVIVEALECVVKDGVYHGAVVRLKDILDLIHRLQVENETLKSPKFASWKLKFFKAQEEKAELQKQVDELKKENEKLRYLADECKQWRWKYGNMNAIGVEVE